MARHTVAFVYTGGLQTVTIPANFAGGFQFDIAAGQGGAGGGPQGGVGGYGGRCTGTYAPTIGDTINVYVGAKGGAGTEGTSVPGASGGYGYHSGGPGGGGSDSGGGGGGGSSAILDGATLLAEAGAGGAAAGSANPNSNTVGGGAGGASPGTGSTGSNSGLGGTAAIGGSPATSSAGGAGGAGGTMPGPFNGVAGTAGTGTVGGTGGASYYYPGGGSGGANEVDGGGGGGGGGKYGGGGGGGGPQTMTGGGGGGGISAQGAAATISYNDNYQAGNGYANVSWQTLPTSTPTAPTGTVTNTSQPTISANYSSAESAPMQAYRIAVYSAAQTMPAAPAIAASPLWDSGIVYASASSINITPGTLTNGNLVAYVAFEDSAGADSLWSAWASTNWTQAAPQPMAPTFTVTAEKALARTNLQMWSLDNLLTANDADFEGSIGSWANAVNCALAQSNAQAEHLTHSMSLTSAAAGNMSGSTATGTSGYAVAANTQYAGQIGFRSAVSARTCTVGIAWYTSAGALISTSTGAGVADTTSGWTTASVVATSPANAAYAALVATVQATGGASEVHYVDEAGIFYSPTGSVPAWTAGGSYPTYFTVQRSLDGGTTWTTVNAGAKVTNTGGVISFDDIGAPREQTISYRVQSVDVSGGNSFVSNWAATQTAYVYSDGQDWLFCAANRALSAKITYQGPNLSALSHEDQAAYFPEGRPDAVVFHGTIHDEQFTSGLGSQLLTFAFPNDAAWTNFKAMRATQQPLLLKSVYGDTGREQWWIVLAGDAGTTRFGGSEKALAGNGQTSQIRTVMIGAYQVTEPA